MNNFSQFLYGNAKNQVKGTALNVLEILLLYFLLDCSQIWLLVIEIQNENFHCLMEVSLRFWQILIKLYVSNLLQGCKIMPSISLPPSVIFLMYQNKLICSSVREMQRIYKKNLWNTNDHLTRVNRTTRRRSRKEVINYWLFCYFSCCCDELFWHRQFEEGRVYCDSYFWGMPITVGKPKCQKSEAVDHVTSEARWREQWLPILNLFFLLTQTTTPDQKMVPPSVHGQFHYN